MKRFSPAILPGRPISGSAGRSRTSWRGRRAFGVERVEAVLQILEELLAGDVARRGGKAHVVGFQRIGDDQLVMVAIFAPIGQVVVIGVGDPGEAAGSRPSVARCSSLQRPVYQPCGRLADDLLVQADRFRRSGALLFLGGMSRWSTHFSPWLAISQPAAFIAATCSGLRARPR
jgi:hypothetical protein